MINNMQLVTIAQLNSMDYRAEIYVAQNASEYRVLHGSKHLAVATDFSSGEISVLDSDTDRDELIKRVKSRGSAGFHVTYTLLDWAIETANER